MFSKLSAAAEPLRSRLEGALAGLSEKDRRALAWLVAILVSVVLIWGLLMPARHARDEARLAHENATTLLAQLRQEGPRLRGVSGARISAAELPQRVQALAGAQGLVLERLESDPSGLRLAINNASVTAVVSFLQQCRNQGIKVVEAQISREGGAGSQVRLRLGV